MTMELNDYNLQSSIGYLLGLTSRVHEKRLETQLREISLSRVAFTVLFAVGRAGRAQPSEIAYFLHAEPPAVSRALKALEKDGLIIVGRADSDKRVHLVGLTPKGQESLRNGIQAAIEANGFIRDALSGAELEALGEMLSKIRGPGEVKLGAL